MKICPVNISRLFTIKITNMPLYKYMPQKYLNAFLEKGSLKIGTLFEYRKNEIYGDVIGDKEEGVHVTELKIPGGGEIRTDSPTQEGAFIREFQKISGLQVTSGRITVQGSGVIAIRTQSQDQYIYCMSSEFNEDVMKQFECDSCLEIIRPQHFFDAISKVIHPLGKFHMASAINYRDRTASYKEPHQFHPSLIKDGSYEYQKEWRAIWLPKSEPTGPLFIDVPRARQHCRAVFP